MSDVLLEAAAAEPTVAAALDGYLATHAGDVYTDWWAPAHLIEASVKPA